MDVTSKRISLTAWGRLYGFDKATTSRLHKKGQLPPGLKIETLPTGRHFVVVPPENEGRCVIYARVSSRTQREDLERQVGRLAKWAADNDYKVDEIVSEIGSALKSDRRKLTGLLTDHTIKTVIVENRERLLRFGYEYVDAALAGRGTEVIAINDEESAEDVVKDATEVMTSLCAKLYGSDTAKQRAKRALEAAADM